MISLAVITVILSAFVAIFAIIQSPFISLCLISLFAIFAVIDRELRRG